MSPPLFVEIQRFRQPWLWALILGVGVAVVWALLALPRPMEAAGRWSAVAGVGTVALLVLLFGVLRLEVRIDLEGVRYQMFPFHLRGRRIPWSRVERAWVRRYSPLREYGGWGMRWGAGGRALNVAGSEGLQLVLEDGERLLLGTQQASRLRIALESLAGRGVLDNRPPER